MKYILETKRLKLRELTLNDTEFVLELVNSPGWLKYIGDRNVKTIKQAEEYLQNGPLKSYTENNFGLWLVEQKADRQAIGMCGLLKRDYLEHPDIGFALLPDFIGSGYAHEAARAAFDYAQRKLKISVIYGIVLINNEKSIRLLEKLGLTFIRTIHPEGSKEDLQLYGN